MQEERTLAVLFADISDSTQFYDQLGSVAARSTLARPIRLMSEITKSQGGNLVKTIGDEVLSTFPSADAAASAAVEMQQRISGELIVDGRPIRIRVGFHVGAVIVESADVFGDAVNLASRLVAQAKPEQILTTAETVELLSDAWRPLVRLVDRAAIKGKREQVDVCELLWQTDMATGVGQPLWLVTGEGSDSCLTLVCAGQSVEVGPDRPSVLIGRSDDCDLVVKDTMVSRLHARVDFRNGRFVLTDLSINGTHVVDIQGGRTFVRRDSHVLHGAGVLSFGRNPESEDGNLVRFIVDE